MLLQIQVSTQLYYSWWPWEAPSPTGTKEAHNNGVAQLNCPKMDAKNCTASTDLIDENFQQIQGIDGVLYAYLIMRIPVPDPLPVSAVVNFGMDSFDDQMIKWYPIAKYVNLLPKTSPPNGKPPLNMYTSKVTDDYACFLQEMKCIMHDTVAKVFVDDFNLKSEFCAA